MPSPSHIYTAATFFFVCLLEYSGRYINCRTHQSFCFSRRKFAMTSSVPPSFLRQIWMSYRLMGLSFVASVEYIVYRSLVTALPLFLLSWFRIYIHIYQIDRLSKQTPSRAITSLKNSQYQHLQREKLHHKQERKSVIRPPLIDQSSPDYVKQKKPPASL